MFEVRDPKPRPARDAADELRDEAKQQPDPHDETRRRHGVLMECLSQEEDWQAEERYQMSVDEDYHDHLQWSEEDALELINRGQAPLVFNEGRLTVEWISGTEKRTRIDYKVLPREDGDEAGADIKTKIVKYTDDVNLAPFHRSKAFKQAVIGGLGWLEEGINIEPGKERIYCASVDWRHVWRDSKSRELDYNDDARYLFRRKRLDLDYAIALLPDQREHLERAADAREEEVEDEWFLGQRLTSAHDLDYANHTPMQARDRYAYIGTGYADSGRREAVNLIECWYKVPETVRVFSGGPLAGKVFNDADPRHLEQQLDGWSMYQSVAWRMRCMIATEDAPLWDGSSPFRHGRFPLVPIYAYRRARDGMCYGVWRGMRDPQYDLNKRMSKALWAASANRVVAKKGAVEDVEEARTEAARPDMFLEVNDPANIRFEKNAADVQFSMELANQDRMMIRTVGGVTGENLGHDTNATSGKAILAKQEQGSMTTADLFDNLRLAVQLAGKLRLSHIEQFMTERQVIRIVGKNKPVEWLVVNEYDPETGEYRNDITAREADFIVSEQDYRASLQQAALEQLTAMMGQIAAYAPQVVLSVLDLLVDLADIPNKDEMVARIRKATGQRDPAKKPSPDEMAAEQAAQQKQQVQERLGFAKLEADLKETLAKIGKLDSDKAKAAVETLYSAIQAAQIVTLNPGVAPVADVIAKGAGFQDQGGDDPQIPQPGAAPAAQPAQSVQPAPVAPPLQQADGVRTGIQTPAADGVMT